MSKYAEHDDYNNTDADEWDVDTEIYKMQQEIEARRSARKRLGIYEDDESILVLEEKIKQLIPVQKKKESQNRNFILLVFIIILLPLFLTILVLAPLLLIALAAIILTIIIIRKVNRRKKSQSNGK